MLGTRHRSTNPTAWFVVVGVCVCPLSRDSLVLVLSLLHWLSTGVPGWLAMVSKLRRGVRGSQGKSLGECDLD